MDKASWQRAKDVIAEALKRAPADRETFVRAQPLESELAAEILTMLAAYDEPDVQRVPPHVDGLDDDDDLQPGTHVGPYVIIDSLGRGGMGQVFLGSDPRLRRKVALKCVIASLVGSGDRQLRILHEARAAARISHPNVATIHDVLEHADRAFIVMEYVEGESLAVRLKRDRLPIDRVIAIGRQLASALGAAHAKGVIHRDLKPANIQLTPEGSVKILDFGIAHAPRQLTSVASGATTSGGATRLRGPAGQPGTPPYMAPEQLIGRTADARSDVYSLGVVLFEMAAGRRPFRETDTADLIVAQAGGVPRADADAAVPRRLADVIAKALALDPTARFESALEVGRALETFERELHTAGEPIARKVARVAAGTLMIPIGLAGIGITTTSGFNMTFGRTGAFAAEPWTAYLRWGFNALLPSLAFMIVTAVVVMTVRFVVRIATLSPPVQRGMQRLRTRASEFASNLGLDRDPSILAQGLAGLGLMALVGVFWLHSDLIGAWMNYINDAAPAQLALLAPENTRAHGRYRIQLDVLTLAFGFGLYRVLQLRKRMRVTGGWGPVLMLSAIVLAFILLNEWPYRTFYHNEGERVDYGNARCYIIGNTVLEFLVFCPENAPPRNRTIRHDDPNLRRLGIIESVFTSANPAR